MHNFNKVVQLLPLISRLMTYGVCRLLILPGSLTGPRLVMGCGKLARPMLVNPSGLRHTRDSTGSQKVTELGLWGRDRMEIESCTTYRPLGQEQITSATVVSGLEWS